jgi:hypothetical protein
VHYKAYGQLDAAKGTAMPLDAVRACSRHSATINSIA